MCDDEVPLEARVARTTLMVEIDVPYVLPVLVEDLGDFVRMVLPVGQPGPHHLQVPINDYRSALRQVFGRNINDRVVTQLHPRGAFHPRIWRNGIASAEPSAPDLPVRSEDLEVVRPRAIAFHRIQRQLADLFEVVTPARSNSAVYGPAISQILATCAMEVEALMRAVFEANTGKAESNVNDWHRLLPHMRLDEWQTELSYFPEWSWIRPFYGWSQHRPPDWWTANNKLKHEATRSWRADLGTVIAAAAAILVLLEAQFGPRVTYMLPNAGLAQMTITARANWSSSELYFPAHRGAMTPVHAL